MCSALETPRQRTFGFTLKIGGNKPKSSHLQLPDRENLLFRQFAPLSSEESNFQTAHVCETEAEGEFHHLTATTFSPHTPPSDEQFDQVNELPQTDSRKTMRAQKPGSVKDPCVACRGTLLLQPHHPSRSFQRDILTASEAKHVKCDDKKPRCQRCERKDVDCVRAQRAIVFRKGTTVAYDSKFSTTQSWVNSRPKKFYVNRRATNNSPAEDSNTTSSNPPGSPKVSDDLVNLENIGPQEIELSRSSHLWPGPPSQSHTRSAQSLLTSGISPVSTHSATSYSPLLVVNDLHARHLPSPEEHSHTPAPVYTGSSPQSFQPSLQNPPVAFSLPTDHTPLIVGHGNNSVQPLQDTTEACLFRYYIEELAHWFDTCDPLRHFQIGVPQRARTCPPLLNAIFAVAARHMARVPRHRTPQGFVYCGQLLPNLTLYTGVEYALKCIPFLQDFHTIHDEEYHENLMAAMVILRQYEEIEEEGGTEEAEITERLPRTHVDEQVNFLAIIQKIIRTAISSPKLSSFANAAFLISVRQEVYWAFVRERAPQIHVGRESWEGMSLPNKIIMHSAEVMKWRWGDRSESEWIRLKEQHVQLVQAATRDLVPVLERKADKTKEEIFPTKWYSSNAEVVGAQHLDLARVVLVAESPVLDTIPHALAARRQAEAQVRALVLNICGIGICHPNSPPALVTGALAIMAYGDYFTEASERRALGDVIEKVRNYCAWPVHKAVQRLYLGWELSDGNGKMIWDIC